MRRWLGLLALSVVVACSGEPGDATTDEAPIEEADPDLGERLEPNETALVHQIADAAKAQVLASQANDPGRVARRDAHPKAHGCVTGSFEVNADVPADLQVGTFTPGKRYDAWIRFSNGAKTDDRDGDARGMAIKLLGVDGPRLLTGEDPGAHTHDLVLTNHHTFFIKSLQDYAGFMNKVTEKGNPISFFISWNPFDWHLREALLARKFTKQPISSPLTSRYWSATPYALGRNVVKYSAVPCAGVDASNDHADDPNYLAAALKEGLSGRGGCFDFKIQKRGHDMSVEDSTVTWEEDDAPFVTVGRLEIPAQTFDSAAQTKHCEDLSFTPWHATTSHRPLGSMNRTRKVVYEATSAARHQLNGAPRREPVDLVVR